MHADFCEKWEIDYPIHSVEVRGTTSNFSWLKELSDDEAKRFYKELYVLMRDAPVIGLACVIDRPGYNVRYLEKYGKNRWTLCKTAFHVAIERAAKYARKQGYRLRVSPERCNKPEDGLLKQYYEDLRSVGLPFAQATSEKYRPLKPEEFRDTLFEFKPKYKTSPMGQFADLYLSPICMGGYHASNRTYERLRQDKELIECVIPAGEWPMLATKYSCFEGIERKP